MFEIRENDRGEFVLYHVDSEVASFASKEWASFTAETFNGLGIVVKNCPLCNNLMINHKHVAMRKFCSKKCMKKAWSQRNYEKVSAQSKAAQRRFKLKHPGKHREYLSQYEMRQDYVKAILIAARSKA